MFLNMLRLSIFLLFLAVSTAVEGCTETVETNSGPVVGKLMSSIWYNKPFYSYRGIPYAKPPVNERRFKAPEPIEKWTKPFEAFKYGTWCAQKSKKPTSEDCLFLNVFVPTTAATKKLPVLFFIPGGNFANGTADDSLYGEDFFLERDVILVTANNRMGIFGYMSLGTSEYSGNMAVKDQQLALKWTYDNIEKFGGNKHQITLGGLSAGAGCVGLHLVNNESSKYFSQILVISGAPNRYHKYQTGDHRCLIEQFYNKHYNTKGRPSKEKLIDFMKTATQSDIIDFFDDHYTRRYSPWTPIAEVPTATNPIIVDDPMSTFKKMKTLDKPAYYTITSYEHLTKFAAIADYTEPEAVRRYLTNFNVDLPIYGYKELVDKRPAYLKELLKQFYDFYVKINASSTDQELLLQRTTLDSDLYYVYAIEKWIEQHVAISKKDTYYHRFSVHTIVSKHAEFPIDFPVAGHADDMPYAFRSKLFYDTRKVIQNKDNDADHALAFKTMNVLQELFTNFIKHGKPVIDKVSNLMAKDFRPIKPKSKSDQFLFVDVTNNGLVPSKSATNGRTKFLDQLVDKVQQLVKKKGQEPKTTEIEQLCESIKSRSN